MLKRYGVVCLLMMAWQVCAQVPRQGGNEAQKAKQEQSQGQPVVHPPQEQEGKKQGDPAKDNPSYWEQAFGVSSLSNWALVVIAALTAYAVWRQVKESAKASEAAKVSAETARTQIQMMKAHERARLDVKAESVRLVPARKKGWQIEAVMTLRNIGRGRAYIYRSAARFLVGAFDEDPPTLAEEIAFPLPIPVEFIDPSDRIIKIHPRLETCPLDLDAFAPGIGAFDSTFYLYGYIEYETMGAKWHHDFGYFWIPLAGANSTTEQMLTTGLWDTHSGLNNPEYEIQESPN